MIKGMLTFTINDILDGASYPSVKAEKKVVAYLDGYRIE